MKRRVLNQAGFSLVEVVLALAVVIFCLVTVFGLLAVGASSSHKSIEQTNLGNVLTAISTDLESTPNPPVSASATPSPRGLSQTSPIFQIPLPATGTVLTASATPGSIIYLGPNGEVAPSVASARYRLSVWTSVPDIGARRNGAGNSRSAGDFLARPTDLS